MAQLFLVRHAQASFGADDYDKLSELGHQQSLLLGKYFAKRDQTFDLLVTGTMLRHKQTADGILAATSADQVERDANWNEFDFDAIIRAYIKAYPNEKPADNAPRSDWYKVLKRAMLAWSGNSLDIAGETWVDFCSRVDAGSEQILNCKQKNVVVVSSGGAMAVFLMRLLNTSVEQAIAFNLQIKNTSISHFFFNKNGFQLSSFNNVPHLDTPSNFNKITYS